MSEYIQTLVNWSRHLEGMWQEKRVALKRSQVQTDAFEQSLFRLHEGLNHHTHDEAFIAGAADEAYRQWQLLQNFANQNETVALAPVPIGGHTLPPLPYPINALEPYIDRETMRIHHDILHKKYVDDLNKAEKELQKARTTNNYDLVKTWERELAFNGAGHYLHTLFWNVMSPEGGGVPMGELASQIQKDFGSFEQFKAHFSAAAEKVEGGGWALLVWSPRAHHLEILQAEKHQNLSQQDQVPLLVLDVWEHAYYLGYKNERKAYIDNWWNIVNWSEVSKRYAEAKKLRWQPY
ncbi:superoxide dismutase [Alkalicoccobacillus murimartini]|uniref:superoxide dismutase n=1 Tax=Alkalicoccobacillus murimartini TaxID=171685 RepID=A0ABT9YEC2_9BACI|nr:superoxide dismutase [Alkalicoccobacillus murimartini]MDQ0205845.1 Fe-Mn family superoxide dismutase [Alkalicoccobacillus murimartini]